MTRDWIWGWVAALPSLIVAFLAIKSTSLYSESPSIAISLAMASATTISTYLLWMKNRQSLLKIRQSGGNIELIIRPIDAFWRAISTFVVIADTIILVYLLTDGVIAIDWSLVVALLAIVSTGILWIQDRNSLKRINQSDGDIASIIARIDGFWETAVLAAAILGTSMLWSLVFERQAAVEWSVIIVIGLFSYLWSLGDTAYRGPVTKI
ncbi:MAG TPA: hypothetical protein VF652_08275, partial [Allosphingosinicella sp.]